MAHDNNEEEEAKKAEVTEPVTISESVHTEVQKIGKHITTFICTAHNKDWTNETGPRVTNGNCECCGQDVGCGCRIVAGELGGGGGF